MLTKNLKVINVLFLLCGLISSPVFASDQIPAPPQKQPIALLGGTIHTVSGFTISNGTILFDKGKIVDIGENVSIPSDALTINISGKHVYPAFIEANSIIGLTEIGAVAATTDFAEVGSVNPSVRVEVAINPDSEHIPVARSNGIAVSNTRPTGGLVAGKAAVIMLDGWTWEDMTLHAPSGLVINWPNLTISTSPFNPTPPDKQKENMKKQLHAIKKLIEDARAYKAARMASGNGVPSHKKDTRLEAMIPVLDGELPVWINANHIKQIQSAIEWATREKIKMVLVGAADAHLALDLLKRKEIPVVVTPILRLPSRRHESFNTPFTLPRKLHKAGIKFCIAGGLTFFGNDRNLPYQAAKAASYGLDKDEALKSVTLYPAQILGISDKVGSLEKGKDATLMITNDDPLEIATQVERLFIQGRDIDLGNKQKDLYKKYQEKYKQKKETIATN